MIGSFNSTNGIPWLPTTHKTLDNLTEELLAHGTGLKSAGTGNIQGRQNLAHSSNGLNKNVGTMILLDILPHCFAASMLINRQFADSKCTSGKGDTDGANTTTTFTLLTD